MVHRYRGTEALLLLLRLCESNFKAIQWCVCLVVRPRCPSSSQLTLYCRLQFLYIKEAFCPSLEEKVSVLAEVRTRLFVFTTLYLPRVAVEVLHTVADAAGIRC